MRVRSLAAGFAAILSTAAVAHADSKSDIDKKIKAAMESYDMMDYDAAKKQLNQALAAAKKAKLDKDPVAARAYLDLGIVAFVNNDPDAAKLAFLSAVQIQAKIQIDAAYKSPEMAKLLEEARSEAKGGGGDSKGGGGGDFGDAVEGGGECSGVKGLEHLAIDGAKANAPLAIEAKLGSDVKASRVSVLFRAEGATDFTEVKLKKEGDCKYAGSIPASGLKGSTVQYYVAAFGDGPKPVASKGSSGSPNIVELSGGAKGGGGAAKTEKTEKVDKEDPINGGKPKDGPKVADTSASTDTDSGGDVSSGVTVGKKSPKVLVAFSGGPGFGYLSGTTEAANPVKSGGFGPSWIVLQPELAYFVSPQMSIGVVARLGLPLGANVNGHSTLAPGALLRMRYRFDESGDGMQFIGQAGVGILRSTLTLDNSMPGMDTDVVAAGPLLLGAGLGYAKHLSGSTMFTADLSVLAGLDIGGADMNGNSTITGAPLNSGMTIDFSIGLAFGL